MTDIERNRKRNSKDKESEEKTERERDWSRHRVRKLETKRDNAEERYNPPP